jgi:hypothetical protein
LPTFAFQKQAKQKKAAIYYNLYFIFYALTKTVILKAPEGKRPKPEQVERQIISAIDDRTGDCGNSLG